MVVSYYVVRMDEKSLKTLQNLFNQRIVLGCYLDNEWFPNYNYASHEIMYRKRCCRGYIFADVFIPTITLSKDVFCYSPIVYDKYLN